ncbi:MAG: hypothetical protein M1821_009959 [Bathelium mastoideum]|nr:MAG: hypothetical protein M1821_009959 [Bathelium mastoideum]KAI9690271.1 MAG: hypothetical protein M1822_009232 [Bathelium mastoideum]
MKRQSVSPPALLSKRRRIQTNVCQEKASTRSSPSTPQARRMSIFSWNINGIQPFVQHITQKPIESFFSPKSKRPNISSAESQELRPKADLRAFLHRHGYPEFLCLQEVKIAPHDTRSQRAVQTAIRPPGSKESLATTEPSYTAHFNLPTDPHNATGFGRKVHGVATIVRDDFAARYVQRVRNVDWDAEGRVQVVEMSFPAFTSLPPSSCSPSSTRKDGPMKLALFNVYLVNGTAYPYRSSQTGAAIGTRHDRKREVHRLLQQECRNMIARGWEVVIAGDVNVARSVVDGWPRLRVSPEEHVINRADFEKRFFGRGTNETEAPTDKAGEEETAKELGGEGGLGLIDSFRWMHGERRGYTYYPREREWGSSCDRVDLIILSQALVSEGFWELKKADILESPPERDPSDHVPLFVQLEMRNESKPDEVVRYLSRNIGDQIHP